MLKQAIEWLLVMAGGIVTAALGAILWKMNLGL